jgi:hypothetical protein
MTARPGYCTLCLEPVIWAVTSANTKWIRLNPDPDPAGNQAAYRDHTETFRTRQLKADEEPQGFERRYMPHVATCTERQQERAPARLPDNVIPINRPRKP